MPSTTIRGAEIHYGVSGAGAPLLLIPGLGLDRNYYRLGTPDLAKHFTVYGVDPRGIGESTKTPPPYTVEAWADDFVDLIEALDCGPMHVLGSSLGGAMALALAERAPQLVESLIVVGGFSELDRAAEMNFALRTRLIELLGFSQEVADYMGLWTMSREFINSEAGYQQMRANQAIIKKNSPELYLAFVKSVLAWGRSLPEQKGEAKFTARLPGIKARTLVIGSSNDTLIPLELSEKIASGIPGAKLVVMQDGGHIPFIEKPAEVVRIVLDFVNAQH